MLQKINRIKKKNDFDEVFKGGRALRGGFLLLKFVPNSLNVKRFGFIASQKVSKKAVVRNRIRRRLNEAVRAGLNDIKEGFDCVFVAAAGIEKESHSEIKDSVKSLLKKAKLIK